MSPNGSPFISGAHFHRPLSYIGYSHPPLPIFLSYLMGKISSGRYKAGQWQKHDGFPYYPYISELIQQVLPIMGLFARNVVHQSNNYNQMHYPQVPLFPQRRITRHISENQCLWRDESPSRRPRLSEPRGKITLIKINKNKLPGDFFQKKENRRHSEQKLLLLPQHRTEPLLPGKLPESERELYSPERTSFFGMLEEHHSENLVRAPHQPPSFLSRKLQTREQSKRDFFGVEAMRKQSNTSKPSKRNMLELFPPTFDQATSDFMADNVKMHLARTANKDQLGKMTEPSSPYDPQKHTDPLSGRKGGKEKERGSASMRFAQQQSFLNITFYQGRSNCLPPINRPL